MMTEAEIQFFFMLSVYRNISFRKAKIRKRFVKFEREKFMRPESVPPSLKEYVQVCQEQSVSQPVDEKCYIFQMFFCIF